MRVLTYNVHGWRAEDGRSNEDLVAEVIGDAAADIVGLNEVFNPGPAQGEACLQRLALRLGLHYAFGATQPAHPHPAHPPYGNAVLSRWPIMAHAAHHLSPQVSYGKRGLLEARIALPARAPLTVYVTHLDHRAEDVRLAQWSAASTWLARDRGRPHLLLGDFNALAAADYPSPAALEGLAAYQAQRGWPAPAFDLVAAVLRAGYADAFLHAGGAPGVGATFPADQPERRIDFIFVPQPFAAAVRSCSALAGAGASSASDHLPVLADLDL